MKGSLAMDFFTTWWFIGIMAVLLVALVGLLIFLRMKPPGD
jgi:cytochrome c biogenesis protein ResB